MVGGGFLSDLHLYTISRFKTSPPPPPRLQLRLKGTSVDPVVGSSYQRDAKSSEKPGGLLMEEGKWVFSPAAGGTQLHRPIPQTRDYFRKCRFFCLLQIALASFGSGDPNSVY